ncbi:MAG: Uma2 family endonuclease [Pirellulaceae bacterium]
MPVAVTTLQAFQAWIHSDAVSEETRACFLDGEVWVDTSKEQLFSHNQVKSELNVVLGSLAKSMRHGRYLPDGMLISNVAANLSAQPVGAFVSYESLQDGKVVLVEGAKHGVVELEGSPDLVIEVVSDSSVEKDQDILPDLYFRAGVRECWLIDARGEPLSFEVFQRGADGFEPAAGREGWIVSNVFGLEFRLTRQTDLLGHPEYTLDSRVP